METALFIFAHIDDETYMAFGAMLKHCRSMHVVLDILCSDVSNLHYLDVVVQFAHENRIELDLRGHKPLQLTSEIVKHEFEIAISKYDPSIVYTHSIHDNHFEHRMIAQESLVACRPLHSRHHPQQLMHCAFQSTFQTFGIHGIFNPNYFIDISGCIQQKIDLLSKYAAQEVIPTDNLDNRSPKATKDFNAFLGHISGCEYAEGFEQMFRVE